MKCFIVCAIRSDAVHDTGKNNLYSVAIKANLLQKDSHRPT